MMMSDIFPQIPWKPNFLGTEFGFCKIGVVWLLGWPKRGYRLRSDKNVNDLDAWSGPGFAGVDPNINNMQILVNLVPYFCSIIWIRNRL